MKPRQLLLSCCLALLAVASVQAQTPSTLAVLPSKPVPGESIGIPFEIDYPWCAHHSLDRSQPPTIRQTGITFGGSVGTQIREYAVSIDLVYDPNPICGVPFPGSLKVVRYIDIGSVPEGAHRFVVTPRVNGVVQPSYRLGPIVSSDAGMPEHASGVWYNPQQSGRGVFVTRTGPNQMSLAWFTHDADGRPTWAVASGPMNSFVPQFTAAATNTVGSPLAPGPAQLQPQPWGELSFRYLGCDRAQLSWNARDPAIVDGSIDLVRLTQPDAMLPCAPSFEIEAQWITP
jgi:hypothetical protein